MLLYRSGGSHEHATIQDSLQDSEPTKQTWTFQQKDSGRFWFYNVLWSFLTFFLFCCFFADLCVGLQFHRLPSCAG